MMTILSTTNLDTDGPTSIRPAFALEDIVSPLADPRSKLSVRRFVDRIYYCRDLSNPGSPEQVYFERELQLFVKP